MQALAESYTLPREFLDLRQTVRQVARERIAPRAGDIDRNAEYPSDVRALLAALDLFGLRSTKSTAEQGRGS